MGDILVAVTVKVIPKTSIFFLKDLLVTVTVWLQNGLAFTWKAEINIDMLT